MDEVVMCAICLNMDVKMFKLQGYQLEDYYTWIVGNVLETNISHYFQYACYECAYQIEKYNSFREKCLRGQSVLIEMLQKKGKLSKSDIKAIDRQKFNLCSKLTYGLKNFHTVGITEFELDCNIKIENMLKDVNEIKIEFQEEKEDETIVSELIDYEHSYTRPVKKKETLKELKTEKTSEENDKHSLKIQRQKKGSEQKSMGMATIRRKSQTLKRKRKPKQKAKTLTTMDSSLAKHFEVVTYTLEEQLQQFMKRKESSTYINSKHKCTICYKGFTDPIAFENHTKRHDPSHRTNVCPICKMCYVTKTNISCHRLQHARNYVCKTCPRVCLTLTQAKLHVKEHEGKTYKCEQCDHVAKKVSSLFTHIRLKHPSDFICDICGFSFVSQLGLHHHKSRHRFEDKSETSGVIHMRYCKVCNVHCNSRQAWKAHVDSLSHKIKANDGFSCEECDKTFDNGEDLKSHRLTLHKKGRNKVQYKINESIPQSWPSKCQHCDQMIPTSLKYYFHLRTSHPDKPYPLTKNHVCDVCGKRFKSSGFLKYHVRTTHIDGEFTFKCTDCSKLFSTKTSLRIHKLSHSDDRPHSCDVCGKGFKTKGNLLKHLKIHTGEKAYPCKYCGKTFIESSGCRIHIMTVHFKQPAPYVSQKRRRKSTEASHSP